VPTHYHPVRRSLSEFKNVTLGGRLRLLNPIPP
jgi:hypothetical protein